MQKNNIKLGYTIREIRYKLGITQRDLAEKTGLTVNYLSLLENGKRGIGWKRLNDIAKVFNIPAQFIIILASDFHDEMHKDVSQLMQQIQILTRQAIQLYASFQKS